MGLSDGERIDYIFTAIKAVHEIEFSKRGSHRDLASLIDRLWYDFLGRSRNPQYWILGSELDAGRFNEGSPLRAAFKQSLEGFEPAKEELPDMDSSYAEPNMGDVLAECDRYEELGKVWSLYRYTESYFYAVNRYKDGLTRSLEPLTKTISALAGRCLVLFSENPIFFEAYLLVQVAAKCLSWEKNDLPTKIWASQHFQHHLKLEVIPQREIYGLFTQIQAGKKFSVNEKVLFLLRTQTGSGFYDHIYSGIEKEITVWNKAKSRKKADMVDLEAVKKIRLEHEAGYKRRKAEPYRFYCHLTGTESPRGEVKTMNKKRTEKATEKHQDYWIVKAWTACGLLLHKECAVEPRELEQVQISYERDEGYQDLIQCSACSGLFPTRRGTEPEPHSSELISAAKKVLYGKKTES